MAGAIAHELKQPLAAIANFARGIDHRIEAGRFDPEPLRDGCTEITQQSQRAAATIERIRSFARKGSSAMQSVNLLAYVREAVELFEVAHPEANIQWQGTPARQDVRVRADPIQIQQVTFNLLKNAMDAQSARGRATAAITVCLEREAQGYRVGVRDQGGQLTEEHLARLFEPFFTTKNDGLGLGLALSKWIIDAHGGTLTLTPEAAGVCASFWLPEEQANA
jgi:two-component system sensor histidine kinase TtrS